MSNHTPNTESDWRKTITYPPGVAERIRERLPEIERAMAFLRDFDPFRRPEIPLPPFARQPAELHAVQDSAETAATSEATIGRGQISWQTARDRLIAIRQGESFTSPPRPRRPRRLLRGLDPQGDQAGRGSGRMSR